MKKNYGKEKYDSLIQSWPIRAERARNAKYESWHTKVEARLASPDFTARLAHLLGIDDIAGISKHGTKNQLIAAVTGFTEAEIEKLRYMPSEKRDLIFAFAFVLGYEYRLYISNDGKLVNPPNKELIRYFDDADIPLPDYKNLNDYIDICAGMYYEECNANKVYGQNRIVTLKDLQDNLRDQLNVYMLDLDTFVHWSDFYEYYMSLHGLSNAAIKKITGYTEENVNVWKKKEPEKAEVLFMICILFHFNLIQTIHVFDHYWHEKDDMIRPDLQNREDLRWLYLAENYWKLKELHYEDQIQLVKDYYIQNNITRSAKLSILQYHEIFGNLTFSMDKKNESQSLKPEKTLIVSDLSALEAVSDYDRVFIHTKDGVDPVKNAVTDISLGYKMDVLHASDPARILWYRKKVKGKKKDASEDLIKDIYYRKKTVDMDENMEKGAELLMEWIGDNSINAYLMKIYDLDKQDKTLVWNKKLSDLQLKKGSYPKRRDLIIAGVLLSMPERGINRLLGCYGYKQLSTHDYTEYVLILILRDMQKTFPDEFCFEAEYTANRADIDHGIQNIGGRRKAGRGNKKGYLSLIREWYPKWFEDQGGKLQSMVFNPRNYLDNETWYTVNPSDYYENWSVRKYVLQCLHLAGFAETNWLVGGLKNPLKKEGFY